MNAMDHSKPKTRGASQTASGKGTDKHGHDPIAMGHAGASMAGMTMPMPKNTLPMMTGTGPFGPLEMGGMFTVVKVRQGLARDDYRDPGWFEHPKGTVAYEYAGELPDS
jgi:hypothetical protein